MQENYIECAFKVHPLQPASDILIAQLAELDFESFIETHEGVLAYIGKQHWNEDRIKELQIFTQPHIEIEYGVREIKQENWNAQWEQSFEPIRIDENCVIRAPFHARPEVTYDIVIEPKMSFGTGHHETTHLMLRHILNAGFKGKSVLDMGCGTGVLAILASMKGASRVDAIDNDPWSYVNAIENVQRNLQDNIEVHEGDAGWLEEQKYDYILANINRNVLLTDLPLYVRHLNPNGVLMLSGFLTADLPLISEKCREEGLDFLKKSEKKDWAAAVYQYSKK